MRRPRIALVGCGAVGRLHAERLLVDGRGEIGWLCDPDRSRAEDLRSALGLSARFAADPWTSFSSGEVDAAVICSPTPAHYEQAAAALEAGLDVLCEKPLATRREHIVDLVRRQAARGRILAIAYQRRYQSLAATARRELTLREDFYGPIREVHLFVCERWAQTIVGTWRDDPSVASGYFGDAGSHQIDAVFFITGRAPVAVFAASERRSARVEVVTRVLARLSGGAGLAAHFVGDAQHWREDLHFHGERADLLIRNESIFRCRNQRIEEIPASERIPDSDPDRAFLDAILQGKTMASPPESALPIFDFTAAVLESVRVGGWIETGS